MRSKIFVFFLLIFQFSFAEGVSKYKYQLAVCAIFQDEAPFLKEWIEFHKLVGVEHFYLYNNLSEDNYLEVLQPYIVSGEIELFQWPYVAVEETERSWLKIQCGAYFDGIQKSRGKVKWVAFIDLDEFLFPVEKESLNVVLNSFENEKIGGVVVNWQSYGTSFLAKLPADRLLIEALLYKAPVSYSQNYKIKSIVRPERVANSINPHFMIYKKGYSQVTENGVICKGMFSRKISVNILRINHYWSRDEEYFFTKKIARKLEKFYKNETVEDFLKRVENSNQELEENPPILRFVEPLREIIFKGIDEKT